MLLNSSIVFFSAYVAFLLSAICGGGAGLILIPILGAFLPIHFIPAALSLGTFTSSGTRLFVFYRFIRWDIVKCFVPPAIFAVWLGAWLLKYVNPLYLEVFVGLFLMTNIPLLFKKPEELIVVHKPTNLALFVIGLMAGFVSGLTGAVGLLFNKFYLKCGMSKEEVVATRAANEILLHLIKLILYALFGLINTKVILLGFLVALAAAASTWSTKKVLTWISDTLFKKIGYFAMALSGLALLSQSTMSIASNAQAAFSLNPLKMGIEAKLHWQQSNVSLEFTIDDGIEVEQVIPLSDLSSDQQKKIQLHSTKIKADTIIAESVYGFKKTTYEAYFFRNHQFLEKIEFD